MTVLILGLVLFLGVHSTRILAEGRRRHFIDSHGRRAWKVAFSLVALLGLVLVIWGYGLTRQDPVLLWQPPLWTRHLAATLNLLAFILVAAAYVPRNHLQAWLGHPMYAGVKVWAFAHLLANGRLGDVVLFGAFLVWAIAGFAAGRRRARRDGWPFPAGTAAGTAGTLAVGVLVWGVFAFYLHRVLIGVPPL